MKESIESDAEYLVRRHELNVARQFLPDLSQALIATDNAGLGGALQALLRVMFGYKPDIRTVCTIGAVLDGLTEHAPDLVIFDDNLFGDRAFDLMSLFGKERCSSEVIVISRNRRPSDLIAIQQTGVADIIHPGHLDSARLTEAYIRACIFSALKESCKMSVEDQENFNSGFSEADVISLEPRPSMPFTGRRKVLLNA